MTGSTPADRIRDARVDELLGDRGKPDSRAARLAELDALRNQIDQLTSLCSALEKRIAALE